MDLVAHDNLGGAPTGREALVITNLSNLDAYTKLAGEAWGWDLAQNLSDAMRSTEGPIVVADWYAPLEGAPESAPRAWLMGQLAEFRDAISWLQYPEDVEDPYDEMLQELLHTLNDLGIDRVILGGIWYGTDEEGGCDDPVIEAVGLYYQVEVRDALVGCGV